jgi:hypothetical protein
MYQKLAVRALQSLRRTGMAGLPEQAQGNTSFHDLMARYGVAFDTYDLDVIMQHYHTPCFIYKDGNAIFLLDEAHKRDYFGDLLARLREAGVHHSDIPDIPDITVTPIGANSAIVTVHWVSKRVDGSVVWEFLDSYYLARVGDRWRFLGDTVHEGDYSKATSLTPS